MRMEIQYYAFDDTRFITKESCLAYEESLYRHLDSVVFFDATRKVIHIIQKSDAANAYYMYVVDALVSEELFEWIGEEILVTPKCS